MVAYTKDMSTSTRYNVEELLYRDGEMVMIHHIRNPKSTQKSENTRDLRDIDYFSHQANSALNKGSVVGDTDNPVIGCIDEYFFDDYFPVDSTLQTTAQSDKILLKSSTVYGEAWCELDATKGFMPTHLEIRKTGEHLTTGGRKLKDVEFDVEIAESLLTEKSFELTDIVLKKGKTGEYFISSCRLLTTAKSQRGVEGSFDTTWKVTSINWSPKSTDGKLSPTLDVVPGERVFARGAEHLPYVWSATEMWPVPLVTDLNGSRSHGRMATAFWVLAVLIIVGAVLIMRRK